LTWDYEFGHSQRMSTTITQSSSQFLTVAAAAAWAGLSVATIRAWLGSGRLTAFRPCGRTLVDAAELASVIRSAAGEPSPRGGHLRKEACGDVVPAHGATAGMPGAVVPPAVIGK
jgi:hypothetical protein